MVSTTTPDLHASLPTTRRPRVDGARALLLAAAVAVGSPVAATTRYVAKDGVDSGVCGASAAQACRTISRAIANAATGDTVLVGPGTYGDLDHNGTLGAGEKAGGSVLGKPVVIRIDKTLKVISGDRADTPFVGLCGSYLPASDLDRATEIARSMVLEYGMSDVLGPMTFPRRRGPAFRGRPRRAAAGTARVRRGHRPGARRRGEAHPRRTAGARDGAPHREAALDRVSKALLEKETQEAAEFEALVKSDGAGRHVA